MTYYDLGTFGRPRSRRTDDAQLWFGTAAFVLRLYAYNP